MANEITLDGWDKFRGKLNNLPQQLIAKTGAIVQDEAMKWAWLAKRSAPVNFGRLRSQIQAVPTGLLSSEVVSPIKYSPYVEWGTGTKVNVPADLAAYAIRFKGSRKVIGMNPKVFFFIHKPAIESSLMARVQKYLNTPQ